MFLRSIFNGYVAKPKMQHVFAKIKCKMFVFWCLFSYFMCSSYNFAANCKRLVHISSSYVFGSRYILFSLPSLLWISPAHRKISSYKNEWYRMPLKTYLFNVSRHSLSKRNSFAPYDMEFKRTKASIKIKIWE
jgi:hypothetical protein